MPRSARLTEAPAAPTAAEAPSTPTAPDRPIDPNADPQGGPGLSVAARQRTLAAARTRMRAQIACGEGFWVFAYASLMWKPAFEPAEQRLARTWGHHRALAMHSRLDRGTPERPGLVFALLPGGSCRGLAQRVANAQADAVLEGLWTREMDSGVYRSHWLPCRTAAGPVTALAFTLPTASPSHAAGLDEAERVEILRHARGRHGRTLDYLLRTAARLSALGIDDPGVRAWVARAGRHGLLSPDGTAAD
jgi:cation transport protein ChaC